MHKSEVSHLAVHEHQRPHICAEEASGICKRVKRIHDPVKIVVPCAEVEFPIPPDIKMKSIRAQQKKHRHRPNTIERHQQTNINRRHYFSIDRHWTRIRAEGVRCVWKSFWWRNHHTIIQDWGIEEEELEKEEKDQGRFSVIIDSLLLRWCQEIQSAQ
ncbi:hypothetical protein DY000_02031162 [Brassica cretica]|uniref:Uncharacterized protein n=1 Tax=Brassica cretica TaxID=69181 RepID=A0ABQ7DVK2_BRACR|nr:hypothetical protein DY000_02031162 [Brassica cretica]